MFDYINYSTTQLVMFNNGIKDGSVDREDSAYLLNEENAVEVSAELLRDTEMARKMELKPSSRYKFFILMAVGFYSMNSCIASSQASQISICESTGCNNAAQHILKYMDSKVNPCDNFYRFACGRFLKEAVIPEDKPSISSFSSTTNALEGKLKRSIEGELIEGDPETFKLLQSYYDICLDTEKIEKSNTEELQNVLKELGNWPVLAGESWSESNFDWQKLIYQLRKIGFTDSINSIVLFDVRVDQKNTTRNIITLDQARTGIEQEYLSKGLEEKVVQAYYKYMIEFAKILGADQKEAEKELTESLNFEMELAKISVPWEERRNMSHFYNLKAVDQLQSEYPYISWKDYLNNILSPQLRIELTNEVDVKVPSFLKSLSQLISTTPKRVLANYMIWRAIQDSALYMNEQIRKLRTEFRASMTGTNVDRPRWAQCVTYVSNNLYLPTGVLYIRRNFDRKSKSDVINMVNGLKESLKNMLEKVDWMDEETKKAALEKIDSTQSHVAYPDEFFDNEKLDKHYESLKLDTDSYFIRALRLNLFNFAYKLDQLKKPIDKNDWIRLGRSAVVNAFYTFAQNSIQIPAGILQDVFFSSGRPNYMNYGGIGSVIGHELTHGFDDHGSQYDKDGNLVNWWNVETQKEYTKRAQCIVDQYSNYTVEEVGMNLNGKNTQGENIADNGGIKEAYYAYEEYERQNGEEPRLPGLPYSPRQMFWISAANLWCDKRRPESLKDRVLTDVHSVEEFRVIGPFSNMPQFSRDFNCPLGSPMNPVKKCTVW